ncbi:hypothetical protein FRC04_001187 [Tulasnella sp. 424]|nr:hypothetical protein FRC04_001187 [Tulasnella sp. 424]KAG8975794.1 hypothetical protein FRC05_005004 [Tulasnella sp. 425]
MSNGPDTSDHNLLHNTQPTEDWRHEGDGEAEEKIAPSESSESHYLPSEIWTEVCRALRQLDQEDETGDHEWESEHYSGPSTRIMNRGGPIFTSRSLVPLSETCRYLYGVSIPVLLETVRLSPQPSHKGAGDLPVLQQIRALGRLPDSRLRGVNGLAVELRYRIGQAIREEVFLSRLDDLLARLPNLRHLTLVRIPLNGVVMRRITALPLMDLRLWKSTPYHSMMDISACIAPRPQVKLRSLLVRPSSGDHVNDVGRRWVSWLITQSMVDMLLDVAFLPPLSDTPTILEGLRHLALQSFGQPLDSTNQLSTFFSRVPSLEGLCMWVNAPTGSSPVQLPILSNVSRLACHAYWLPYLVRGTRAIEIVVTAILPATTPEQILQSLSGSTQPVQRISLHYESEYPQGAWPPDALEELVHLLPDLEYLRFRMEDPTQHDPQKSLRLIGKLRFLQHISFNLPSNRQEFGPSWQESTLAQLIDQTKSSKLRKVSFVRASHWEMYGEKCIWKYRMDGSTVAIRYFDSKLITASTNI